MRIGLLGPRRVRDAAGQPVSLGGRPQFGGGERLPMPVLPLVWSALLRTRAGRPARAAAELDMADEVARRLDNPVARARVAHARGVLAQRSGEPGRGGYRPATMFLAAATAVRGLAEVATPRLVDLRERCAGVLGEPGFRVAWQEGQGLAHPETLPLPQLRRA